MPHFEVALDQRTIYAVTLSGTVACKSAKPLKLLKKWVQWVFGLGNEPLLSILRKPRSSAA